MYKNQIISILRQEMSESVTIEGFNGIENIKANQSSPKGTFDLMGRPSSKASGLRIESGRITLQ